MNIHKMKSGMLFIMTNLTSKETDSFVDPFYINMVQFVMGFKIIH